MAITDKDNQPFDEHGLDEHIATALAVEEPQGRELDIIHAIVKRFFKPTVVGAENIPDRPCLFVGNHSLFALDGMVLGPGDAKRPRALSSPHGGQVPFRS